VAHHGAYLLRGASLVNRSMIATDLANCTEKAIMAIMTIWPPTPESLERPAYRSLARAVAAAIAAGELRPGDRLPTHRDLARRLGLSVQTVSRAYEALIRADVIAGEVGRGSFVKSARSMGRAPRYHWLDQRETIIDCSILTPVTGDMHARAMSDTLSDLSGTLEPEILHSFRPRLAMQSHAERAVGWLQRCGLQTRPELVLPTNGNTPAMTIALMAAASQGDLVVTEEFGHHTLKALTHYLGLRLAGLACDTEGIKPDAFARACETLDARVLYVMPPGNSPMARTMGAERRTALVDIARRHDVAIVENDAWGPMEPDRPAPIAALAPERTFYFTGLSKCLLPALRVGYLVVPEKHLTGAFGRHLVTNWVASPLVVEIASRWITDGTAERLLQWQRRALARRNGLVRRCFEDLAFYGNPHGLHVWLPLPSGWDEATFVNSSRLRGVAVAPGSAFDTGPVPAPHQGVRICLGAPSEHALEEGLTTIARLARNRAEPDFLTI
jgi:DNA-binding transcriptional MocR family regulator